MRLPSLSAAAGALALSACATTPAAPGLCDAGPGNLFVGQKADAGSGLAIRRATGSTVLRWVPPRTAVTMDFSEGRVTVSYDDEMTITAVSCG